MNPLKSRETAAKETLPQWACAKVFSPIPQVSGKNQEPEEDTPPLAEQTLLLLTRESLAGTTANTTEQEITAWTQKHKEANAKWQFVPRVQCGFAFKNLMRAGCGAAQLSFRHLPLRRPEFKTSLNYIARPCLLPPHPTKKKKVMCNSSN